MTSPILPELVTEMDRLEELNDRVGDAIKAVIELYDDMGRELPTGVNMLTGFTGSTGYLRSPMGSLCSGRRMGHE